MAKVISTCITTGLPGQSRRGKYAGVLPKFTRGSCLSPPQRFHGVLCISAERSVFTPALTFLSGASAEERGVVSLSSRDFGPVPEGKKRICDPVPDRPCKNRYLALFKTVIVTISHRANNEWNGVS